MGNSSETGGKRPAGDPEAVPGEDSFADRLHKLAPPSRVRSEKERVRGPGSGRLFGRRAIHKGYATEAQVLDALTTQFRSRKILGVSLRIGEILWLKGVIDSRTLDILLADPDQCYGDAEIELGRRVFGDYALLLRYCSASQILEALDEQREASLLGEPHAPIGRILVEKGYVTEKQLKEIIAAPLDFDTTSIVTGGDTGAQKAPVEDAPPA